MSTLEVSLEGLIPTLGQQIVVNGTTDKLPIVDAGSLKYVTPTRLAAITSIDPVPIDSTPGTVDVTGKTGRVVQITGTGDISTITIDDEDTVVLEFLTDGGTLGYSANLLTPGSANIVWAVGDRAYIEGLSGSVANVVRFERKSGVPVNKGIPVVKVVSYSTNITIATALNNGDTLEGIALVTGDLVLVVNQTDLSENGIYTVGPSPARTTNYDNFEAFVGLEVYEVQTGADVESQWFCVAASGGVIDTDDLEFIQIQGTIARQNATAAVIKFVWDGLTIATPVGAGSLQIVWGDNVVSGTETLSIKTNGASRELSLLSDVEIDATLAATRPVSAKTTDYVVVDADDQKIFTNTGAAGTVKFTLPANAGCTAGKTKFKFVALAGEVLQVEPASGTIYGWSNLAAYTATNGAPVDSQGDIGEWLEVTYMGSNVWHAVDSGKWS
jgi:hypothetical protein